MEDEPTTPAVMRDDGENSPAEIVSGRMDEQASVTHEAENAEGP